jgi:glucose-6-phosphate isomerase
VPQILLTIPDLSEFSFGYLVYFFEKACAVSGYVLARQPLRPAGR